MGDERHEARAPRDRYVAPVTKRLGWDADEQVTGDAPGETHDDREHHDTEGVEPGSNPRQASAETEHERAGQVEDEQERRIEGVENRSYGPHGADPRPCDTDQHLDPCLQRRSGAGPSHPPVMALVLAGMACVVEADSIGPAAHMWSRRRSVETGRIPAT